jgi:hypothetical protein
MQERPAPAARFLVEPTTLTILGTYKCTAACKNCCFSSNPYIQKRLGLSEILDFIQEGSRYSACKLVVFSGGECFLLKDDLVEAVRYATSLGLSTRCITNGHWAKRMEYGRGRLLDLRAAGLDEINVSTGDFHQQYVDEQTVINAAWLSVEVGMKNTVMMVEVQKERRVTANRLAEDPRMRVLLTEHASRFQMLESPWMPTRYDDVVEQRAEHTLTRNNVHLRSGCTSILSTIVLTPDRKVGYCCGLSRERIPSLNADWDGNNLDSLLEQGASDFMKIWLWVEGPERILAWAASKDKRIDWEGRYAHHCHACLALFDDPLVRETIRTHYRERVDDVLMRFLWRLRSEESLLHDFSTSA